MSDRYVHAVIQRHFPPTVIDSGEHRGDYACRCGILVAGGADGAFWVAHLLQEIDDAALDVTFKALPLLHLEANGGNIRAAWEAWKALPSSEKSRRRLSEVRGTADADSFYPDGEAHSIDETYVSAEALRKMETEETPATEKLVGLFAGRKRRYATEMEKWATAGWMRLFETMNAEWGPHDTDHYLTTVLPSDAPQWLRADLRERLSGTDFDG